jgi:hypothetical protein
MEVNLHAFKNSTLDGVSGNPEIRLCEKKKSYFRSKESFPP